MSALARHRGSPVLEGRPGRAGLRRPAVVALLATALVAGCDDTLEPFQEADDAVFSMFGYLDLKADTQWVRVMPVRRSLFLEPGPLDAVVTLEHLGSGRVVTLHDSVFRFVDERLGGAAYAHNFWTTEPIEPEESYRLGAIRSDGASSTATVDMPPDPEVVFVEDNNNRRRGTVIALLQVRAERVLTVETLYDMGRPVGDPPVLIPVLPESEPGYATFPSKIPGMIGIHIDLDTLLFRPGLVDVVRRQFRIAVGRADWPYEGLTDLEITLPSTAPSNVENGLGFVGGVATLLIPFDACDAIQAAPGDLGACATEINARTASIEGTVIREPCGDPYALQPIRLVQRAGDGGIVRTWKTGWYGRYRFLGVEPNTDLSLELPADGLSLHLPSLQEGERYTVEDIAVSGGC